jgi:hypothetical protein
MFECMLLLGWTQRTILLGEGVVGATVGSLASGAIVSSIRIECMLLARSDFQVHHEPMGEAWYYGDERASTRFTDERARQLRRSHREAQSVSKIRSESAPAHRWRRRSRSLFRQSWREVAKPHPTLRTFSKGKAGLWLFFVLLSQAK